MCQIAITNQTNNFVTAMIRQLQYLKYREVFQLIHPISLWAVTRTILSQRRIHFSSKF